MRRLAALLLAAWCANGAYACSLNPQPLPPGETGGAPGPNNPITGGSGGSVSGSGSGSGGGGAKTEDATAGGDVAATPQLDAGETADSPGGPNAGEDGGGAPEDAGAPDSPQGGPLDSMQPGEASSYDAAIDAACWAQDASIREE
jgi:hypothetical protein